MEEDEQARPEGDKGKVPEPELPRCGRHPSHLLTGIYSSCIMERLSSVPLPARGRDRRGRRRESRRGLRRCGPGQAAQDGHAAASNPFLDVCSDRLCGLTESALQVICSLCSKQQDVQQNRSNCWDCMGKYFCKICKSLDVSKDQYHFDGCGICR